MVTQVRIKRTVGIYMRIPMYNVMGGAPVGCSPRIKGGVPGQAIVKFLHFCIMAVECRFGRAAFFFFSSALCEPYPTQNGCMSPFMVRM